MRFTICRLLCVSLKYLSLEDNKILWKFSFYEEPCDHCTHFELFTFIKTSLRYVQFLKKCYYGAQVSAKKFQPLTPAWWFWRWSNIFFFHLTNWLTRFSRSFRRSWVVLGAVKLMRSSWRVSAVLGSFWGAFLRFLFDFGFDLDVVVATKFNFQKTGIRFNF